MAVFISVVTSPWEEARDQSQSVTRAGIRRPVRGFEAKPDTYSVLRVLRADGRDLNLFNAGASEEDVRDGIGRSSATANFLIQSITEQRAEKQQIVETFGEDYIFFFGERPRFLAVQGLLLNTASFDWKSEFLANYDLYLRGTRLVEHNARLYFYYDNVVVEGYLTQSSVSRESQNPHTCGFNFQMFVTNYAILSNVGSVTFQDDAVREQAELPPPTEEAQKEAANKAAAQGAGGGLNSFLASTHSARNTADVAFQSAVEDLRNALYGRRLVVPDGLGETISLAPIANLASFPPAETNQPISRMVDEYVSIAEFLNAGVVKPAFDQDELDRVDGELKARSPEELQERARAYLEERGIDTSRPSAESLLLGRAAFAGLQVFGSFGLAQVLGEIDLAHQFGQ